jgi:hypothetical protein
LPIFGINRSAEDKNLENKMLAEAFVVATLKKTTEKITTSLASSSISLFQLSRKDRAIKAAAKKLVSLANVKTLWQIDKSIPISDFFVLPRASYLGKEFDLGYLKNLPASSNIVIEGVLGQGKSILLRHLAVSSIAEEYVPIFITAHSLNPALSIAEHIRLALSDLASREITLEESTALLRSGFFIVFIDGFDEITPARESTVITEIQRLTGIFESNLRIIVSSRPDNAIQKCPEFVVVKLTRLREDRRNELIHKLMEETQQSKGLVAAVQRASNSFKSELLSTPLMVVVLVIVYKYELRVPETFSEFFEHLFEILLIRHDSTKPGFSRARKTKLGITDFRRLFEAFCFASNKQQLPAEMARSEVIGALTAGSEAVDLQIDPDAYLDDVERVTCLLVYEGLKFHFIHKAIQNFFSAQYIRSCSEDAVKEFYEEVGLSMEWVEWAPELAFLRRIDGARFNKYLYLPLVAAHRLFDENHVVTEFDTKRLFSELRIDVSAENEVRMHLESTIGISIAERDFLFDFFVPKVFEVMLGDANLFAAIRLKGSEFGLDKKAKLTLEPFFTPTQQTKIVSSALSDFRVRLQEARNTQLITVKKASLLRLGTKKGS